MDNQSATAQSNDVTEISAADLKFMSICLKYMKNDPKFDWKEIAAATGTESWKDCRVAYSVLRQKLEWYEVIDEGEAADAPLPHLSVTSPASPRPQRFQTLTLPMRIPGAVTPEGGSSIRLRAQHGALRYGTSPSPKTKSFLRDSSSTTSSPPRLRRRSAAAAPASAAVDSGEAASEPREPEMFVLEENARQRAAARYQQHQLQVNREHARLARQG